MHQRLVSIGDDFDIVDEQGAKAFRIDGKVRNAMITPLRDRWSIDIPGGEDLHTTGNILQHEYHIERGGTPVAMISKRWFRVRDTYGVEVAPGEDDALVLAVTVVIDMMANDGR